MPKSIRKDKTNNKAIYPQFAVLNDPPPQIECFGRVGPGVVSNQARQNCDVSQLRVSSSSASWEREAAAASLQYRLHHTTQPASQPAYYNSPPSFQTLLGGQD